MNDSLRKLMESVSTLRTIPVALAAMLRVVPFRDMTTEQRKELVTGAQHLVTTLREVAGEVEALLLPLTRS